MSTDPTPESPRPSEFPSPADAARDLVPANRIEMTPVPAEDSADFVFVPAPPRLKFQHRYGVHIALFLLTFLTTSFHNAFEWLWLHPPGTDPFAFFTGATFVDGLWYSIPLLVILGAHEFGHYFACRYYNVDATLPYFIPAPLPITGTLGAVIRIREMFPSRRALFDIGVAGPLAGFVMLLPFLVIGVFKSTVAPIPPGAISFGDPLLFKIVSHAHFGRFPPGWDVMLHPLGFAAWWGMLATALNLLPFSQLDGGHLSYAVFGRRATWVSAATLAVVFGLAINSVGWRAMAIMLAAMAAFIGVRHPRPLQDEPLGPGRKILAVVALVIFVLCFTLIPIDDTPAPAPARQDRKIEVHQNQGNTPGGARRDYFSFQLTPMPAQNVRPSCTIASWTCSSDAGSA